MRNPRRNSDDGLWVSLVIIMAIILLARASDPDWASAVDRLAVGIAAFGVIVAVLIVLRSLLQRRKIARIRRQYLLGITDD